MICVDQHLPDMKCSEQMYTALTCGSGRHESLPPGMERPRACAHFSRLSGAFWWFGNWKKRNFCFLVLPSIIWWRLLHVPTEHHFGILIIHTTLTQLSTRLFVPPKWRRSRCYGAPAAPPTKCPDVWARELLHIRHCCFCFRLSLAWYDTKVTHYDIFLSKSRFAKSYRGLDWYRTYLFNALAILYIWCVLWTKANTKWYKLNCVEWTWLMENTWYISTFALNNKIKSTIDRNSFLYALKLFDHTYIHTYIHMNNSCAFQCQLHKIECQDSYRLTMSKYAIHIWLYIYIWHRTSNHSKLEGRVHYPLYPMIC